MSLAQFSPKVQWETGVKGIKLSFFFFFFISTSAAARVSFPLLVNGKDNVFLSLCPVTKLATSLISHIPSSLQVASHHQGMVVLFPRYIFSLATPFPRLDTTMDTALGMHHRITENQTETFNKEKVIPC